MSSLSQFILAALDTYGFTIYFKLPYKVRFVTSVLSGFIWFLFEIIKSLNPNYIFSNFTAAVLIGLFSEIMAIVFKKPATVFLIPCLVPLVPGAGMYYIMYHFIGSNYNLMQEQLILTILTSAALALGVVVSQGLFRIFRELVIKKNKNQY